ncbi:hypothetical protein E2C01_046997 [Portunus trituberculatus]|uniref:HTH psq-type domain-containing protein n=1 Tax=Portunus trituberculatus TaxID=210409 RepID=A0A5B7G2F7_PORTR|nr:hypothetical protein [Portunus trituberculatus]
MPPKRPAMSPSVAKKTRKSLILKVKLDIIHRHERGEKTCLPWYHGLTPSSVSTIFKSADSINPKTAVRLLGGLAANCCMSSGNTLFKDTIKFP